MYVAGKHLFCGAYANQCAHDVWYFGLSDRERIQLLRLGVWSESIDLFMSYFIIQ